MQSDRWIEKGDFGSETKSGILSRSKKCLFDTHFSIEQSDPTSTFSTGCADRISIEKVFEAHRISHHPTRYTITPYNSSDAGLTAAAAAAAGVLLMSLGRKNGLM